MNMKCVSRKRVAACLGIAIAAGQALAQPKLIESFDDLGGPSFSAPAVLVQRGWEFRNQSQPLGTRSYFPGILPSTNPIYFAPQAGSGYLAVDNGSTSSSGGNMSVWAILPPVPGQQAGDLVTVWLRSLHPSGGMEIRYSPSGGTSTGSGAIQTGDFTQVLLSTNPVSSAGWMKHETTVPGSGRIALRYYGVYGGIGNPNPYVGIDSLTVGPVPPPPCKQPPTPAAGQTVTWTAAGGPYLICNNMTIPQGATVNVEPGTSIDFVNDMQLFVQGTLNVNGTAASPVLLKAPDNFPPYIVVQGGTLDADHADFRQQVRIGAGADVFLHDCTFVSDGTNLRGGMLLSDSIFGPGAVPYVLLDGCTFTQSLCTLSDCISVLRNNTFDQTGPWLLRGFADVSQTNTFIGRAMEITRELPIQASYVDGVQASGVTTGGGLCLSGGNWLLGPNNQLTGNLYPLSVEGGLLPGSIVPPSGNTNNAVDIGSGGFRGSAHWPLLPIPYRLTEQGDNGGDILIEPGVTVEALPGAGLYSLLSRDIRARGTPQAPITFKNALPGQNWDGMFYDTAFNAYPHLENCIFEGAKLAVVGSDTVTVRIDNCRFSDNVEAGRGGFNTTLNFGKTLFTGNGIGASGRVDLLNQSNPNAFEGNTVAVEGGPSAVTHAEVVWWNSPSGPSNHPQNPGGTGDPIGGYAGSVSIFPFLTERPNFQDDPPIVRVQRPGLRNFAVLNPGEKYLLEWEASDDADIVSQKVTVLGGEFGPHVIAQDLPGSQRRLEFAVPSVGFEVLNTPQRVQVEAVDTAGQVASDLVTVLIPSERITGSYTFTPQTNGTFVGQTFFAGQDIPTFSWTGSTSPFPSIDVYLIFDADSWYMPGNPIGGEFPHVSTDLARLAIRSRNNSNDQKWFYSGYFSVRHDPRLGFQPPQVELLSPANGAQFAGGGVVPISWTATATEGLYSFDIQASYNGGVDWYVIARGLPATASSYNWQLPESDGIADVRVRIIARDKRGQNSSDGMDRIFSITAGSACYANCDGSTAAPALNVADFGCFLNRFAAGDPYANCDGSTAAPVLNVADFGCFLSKFAAGCP